MIRRNLWSRPWRHKRSPITLKTCSGYLGEYPGSLLTWIWKVVFLPILVLFHWYICLCVCISVIKPIIDVPRKLSWKGPILMWTCFMHLGVYPRLQWNISEKMCFEPSQIATIQESLPSQFVICRNLWSSPWRHKRSPITLKTCSGYMGEYPGSLLTWIWKVVFLTILVLFHWYICLCVCLSVIKLIIDVPSKPSSKGPMLMWTCLMHLGVYPRLLWNLFEKLCFEPSQIATVTNCDTIVAISDLSQFVIKAVLCFMPSVTM